MALFKILNNIDSKNSLPKTANKGYCYFDANTNLFYIDIKDGSNITPTDETYRVPLNAAKAAYASVALKDFQDNVISKTYFSDLSITGAILSGLRPDGTKKDVTIPTMEGATLAKAGSAGLVPAPQKGAKHYFFRGDGSWSLIGAKINGTVFNGVDNITTASWGTERTFHIEDHLGYNSGDTVSIDGSQNITLKLPKTIKADIDGSVSNLAHKISINGFEFDGSADVSIGLIGEKYGGTGQSNLKDSANVLINALTTKTDALTDDDYIIAQYAGGGTVTKTYHRYTASKLWNYIKSKADSTYAAKSHTHAIADITNLQPTLDGKAAANHTHNYAGSSSAGGDATWALNMRSNGEGTANKARHVWFSDNTTETKRVHTDNFTYNPATQLLTTNVSGNAASASKVNHTLSFTVGGISKGSFNGSEDHTVDVNAMDLNISGALTYLGRTNTKPTTATLTLTTGKTVTAVAGNVVICTADNKEYLYDNDGTWVDIGGSSSYSLKPHIHGNIDSAGFLTSELGVAQANKLVRTDGTGKIIAGLTFGTGTTKFLAENGTWQTSGYHKTGSWSGLTYTALAVNGAEELKFTLPTGTSGTTVALGNHTHSQYLPLTGGTMTGTLTLKADPTANLQAATKQYVDNKLSGASMVRQDTTVSAAAASVTVPTAIQTALNKGGSLLVYQEGLLLLPTINYTIASGNGSITLVNYSCEAGDTFSFCVLPAGLKLTDISNSTYLPKAGGTMTGALTLSGAPTANLHAATKAYVDSAVESVDVSDQLKNYAKTSALSAYVKKAGDTMTGQLKFDGKSSSWIAGRSNAAIRIQSLSGYSPAMSIKTNNGSWEFGAYDNASYADRLIFSYATDANFTASNNKTNTNVQIASSGVLYGACWNDYAEYREGNTTEAGRCVVETGNDSLAMSTTRMMPGASIVSDTFGFAIGETDDSKTPIAVSGRVLAYPYENREEFKKAIGRPVCSGPDGTVSIMSDEEYAAKGYCAIGIISAVPDYETWGTGNVPVNGRVWIKVI